MDDKIIKKLGGKAPPDPPELGSGAELAKLLHSGLHESKKVYRFKPSSDVYLDHFEFVAPEPVRPLEGMAKEFLVQRLGRSMVSRRGVVSEHEVYVGVKTGWVHRQQEILAKDITAFLKALVVVKPKKWKPGQPLQEHTAIFPEGAPRESGTVLKVNAAGDRMALTRRDGVSVGVLSDGSWRHQLCFDFEAVAIAFDETFSCVCAVDGKRVAIARWDGETWREEEVTAPSDEQHGSEEVPWPAPEPGAFNSCALVAGRLYAVGRRVYCFECADGKWTCTRSWSISDAGGANFPQDLFRINGGLAIGAPPTVFLEDDGTLRTEVFAGDESLAGIVKRSPPIPCSLHDSGEQLLFSSMVFRREGSGFVLATRFAPKKKIKKGARFVWNAFCGEHAVLGCETPEKDKKRAWAAHHLFRRQSDGSFEEMSTLAPQQILRDGLPTLAALSTDALFQYFERRDEIQRFEIPNE